MSDMSQTPSAIQLSANPVILALDTCTEACSAALWANGQLYADMADAPREHSQRLLPMIDALLTDAGLILADVDLLAYGRGPGSFTGIRICTSMTQGLALARELPVIGISTLAAMAQQVMQQEGASEVLAAIDARMGEVYMGQFKLVNGLATLVGEEQVCPPELVALADAGSQVYACGTGFDAYPQLLELNGGLVASGKVKFPCAAAMIELAKAGIAQGQVTSVDDLEPVYLRDTVAWKKLPGRE
ncbi:tRNA (adenosine(37)-N6)-threonylcarbamoyltransferase complex dimerization subunit type 1 TsaB [Shewanella sedimentimangrovi]|uniref:tRNA threonylcarbamoyladenosine biosynthesis protein TsaB n=1 Tax=Shewanella sedimentimangrovi TaxID=2814293 RepID=A0ABX7R4J0_9GAMM|nr:tRNA (adenosine(37)-N6)-threonylcarbamoyltransferase complex dimerization subunit type 1 TsaB [Shewanella sedimentimangrovi]QSX38746.1 tRNA (adenosine(37)-N6)-threonylcarbamoyltransferase complex dimerization subunit type 1 TsaB [Shewanella sedimentimangrovi]